MTPSLLRSSFRIKNNNNTPLKIPFAEEKDGNKTPSGTGTEERSLFHHEQTCAQDRDRYCVETSALLCWENVGLSKMSVQF